MEDLRDHIGEIYDGGCYEPITGMLWKRGQPFQLFKFERDVEFESKIYRCLLIVKNVYDSNDLTAVEYSEDISFEFWSLD